MQRRYDGVTEDFSLSRLHLTTEVGKCDTKSTEKERTHSRGIKSTMVGDTRGWLCPTMQRLVLDMQRHKPFSKLQPSTPLCAPKQFPFEQTPNPLFIHCAASFVCLVSQPLLHCSAELDCFQLLLIFCIFSWLCTKSARMIRQSH